jgi:hypothetical protein
MTHFQYLNSDDALIENTLTAWQAYSRTLTEFASQPNPPEWEPLPPSWPPMAPGARYDPPAEAERQLMPWAEGWEFLRGPAHHVRPQTAWSTAATKDNWERESEMADIDLDGDTIVPDDFPRPDSPHPEIHVTEESDEDSDTETLCEEEPRRPDEVHPIYRPRWENQEVQDPRTAEVRDAIKAEKARISGALTRFRKLQKLMNRDHSRDTQVVYL